MKAKFNKSEIMKQAWTMFRSKFYGMATFSEALTRAWYYAKQEAFRKEQVARRMAAESAQSSVSASETKRDSFYRSFTSRNNAAYRNVRFGRNDWAVDYRRY